VPKQAIIDEVLRHNMPSSAASVLLPASNNYPPFSSSKANTEMSESRQKTAKIKKPFSCPTLHLLMVEPSLSRQTNSHDWRSAI
jgi:hypothetical protein